MLARAERAIGLSSWSVALDEPPFGIEVDEVLRGTGTHRLTYERRRLLLLIRALTSFDVVHYNFGRAISPRSEAAGFALRSELRLLRAARKGIVVTFQGDDARRGDALAARFTRSLATVAPQNYGRAADAVRQRRVSAFDASAAAIFYLNPDLTAVLPSRSRFLAYASVDLTIWSPAPLPRDATMRVAHAPSDPAAKGTADIVRAVAELERTGVAIELDLISGVSRAEVRARLAAAHVFVDQLYAGWYGGAAVEAMALARPVVAYIRDEDLVAVPRVMREALPVIATTPERLQSDLRRLASTDVESIATIGRRSRDYVETFHDPLKIAQDLAAVYASIISGPRGR